jgi:glycosyltransferase involved in cell wall biosynthesis
MASFAPDAWLVYGASAKNPDLFGWWQHPRRYVLLNTYVGSVQDLPRRWRWLFELAYRRSLSRADRITAERPKNADHLRDLGLNSSRLCFLPLSIDVPESLPSREDARSRLGLPQQSPILLCVSRLTAPRDDGKAWKTEWVINLLNVIAEAKLPADVLVLLVGDGSGRGPVEARIEALGLQGRVKLVGAVANADVMWFYRACDLYTCLAETDRTFYTTLEAQAFARPVLTTYSRSSSLTVDAGRTGILARDIDEFRRQLRALTADRRRCDLMGAAGPAYIAKHHSVDTRVRQIEALLTDTTVPEDEHQGAIRSTSPSTTSGEAGFVS